MQKIIILILILIAILCTGSIKEEAPSEVDRIDKAIHFILTKGLPKHKIFPHPRHKVVKDPDLRLQIALAIYQASKAKNVPAPLLIALGFREGSFKPDSIGDLGEISLFQMTPQTIKEAQKLDPRCNNNSIEGTAFCCATWLKHWDSKCDGWRSSLAMYATGKSCNPLYSSRVAWLTKDRLGIARKLSKKFWDNDVP